MCVYVCVCLCVSVCVCLYVCVCVNPNLDNMAMLVLLHAVRNRMYTSTNEALFVWTGIGIYCLYTAIDTNQ